MTLSGEFRSEQGRHATATVHLRVLATSDLHAHLLPFDYFTDTRAPGFGLARLAEMIAAARLTCPNTLLVDNGDTLQGTPLGDAALAEILPQGRPHPMITAMNAIGYDAATVGNHDFDFGTDHLEASLSTAAFPVVSANANRADGSPFLPTRSLLDRHVTDSRGARLAIRIGITGALPPQTADWTRPHLQGRLTFRDIADSVAAEVAALRHEGADIVVVLAHSGLGTRNAAPMSENVALQVAGLPGVDAVVAGHTHKTRPAAEPAPCQDTPLVQPGAFGSHLGCIDLVLSCRAGGSRPKKNEPRWQVLRARSGTFAVQRRTPPTAVSLHRLLVDFPELRHDVARDHRATRTYVARPLGQSAVPLETYFSTFAPCAATQLVADAQLAAAAPLIAACPSLSGLPVLSAAAPFKAGGRSGPDSYSDVPAGPLKLRHAADLYIYPNMLCVLRLTGCGIRRWLERSTSIYRRIDPSLTGPQHLLDHDFAPYNFDRICGLRYEVDVTHRAHTSADGVLLCDVPGRVRDIRLSDGRPLEREDEVLVVTNSYRAAGGGHMRAAAEADQVLTAAFSVRDAVARYIMDSPRPIAPRVETTFRFRPLGGVPIVFETGPAALAHRDRFARLGLRPLTKKAAIDAAGGFQPFVTDL